MSFEDKNLVIKELELNLITIEPELLKKYIRTIQDIVNNKSYLKYREYNEKCFVYLIDMLIESKSKILVKTDGEILKVLKSIVKFNPQLNNDVINRKLFTVFKKYINHKNDVISSNANILLKDRVLNSIEILWLIDNVDLSEHIVNRILRHPVSTDEIALWAESTYKSGALWNRKSEVIALTIKDNIFPQYVVEDNNTKIWSIYYCKHEDNIKKKLLIESFNIDGIESFVNVCLRLGYYDTIIEAIRIVGETIE